MIKTNYFIIMYIILTKPFLFFYDSQEEGEDRVRLKTIFVSFKKLF